MDALPKSENEPRPSGAQTTPHGTTFTLPESWRIESQGRALLLRGPDSEVLVALAEGFSRTADEAVGAAWSVAVPQFGRKVKIVQSMPARDGWDEVRNYGYELSPDERMMISAMALRRANDWTVLLFYGSEAGFERRKAQVRLIAAGVRPEGFVRESFQGRSGRLTQAGLDELKRFVEQSLKIAGIPGSALCLVNEDQVLFEGGFGVRQLGQSDPIDADTRFLIASNTKQFTTLLLAKLVDEGKFDWETPVQQVFPSFKLGDDATAEQMRMKHLVSASTGLPRKDLEWLLNYGSSNAQNVFTQLEAMKPTSKFGEVFQYSNILGSAAGYIAGHSLYPDLEIGKAFDQAMQRKVFEPLGMSSTTFDYAKALASNHASPHSEDMDGRPAVASMDINFAAIPMRPSLGVWTTARDLTRYVRMELARGVDLEGRRYISEAALLARRKPGVVFEEDGAYGMGLVLRKKCGVQVVDHGGALIGFKSNIFWLPDHGIGGALLMNADNGNLLVQSFIRKLLEVFFEGRSEAEEDVRTSARLRQEQISQHRKDLSFPPHASASLQLARRYRNAALGELRVQIGPDAVTFDFGDWKSAVASRTNEDGTLSFFTVDPGVSTFEFVATHRGLLIRDKQHEYLFEAL